MKIPNFLVCPNCGRPMNEVKDYHSGTKYSTITYSCNKCCISRVKSDNPSNPIDIWSIPNKLRMTDLQKDAIEFIQRVLSVEFTDPPTKSNAQLFICENLDHAEEMDEFYQSYSDPFGESYL